MGTLLDEQPPKASVAPAEAAAPAAEILDAATTDVEKKKPPQAGLKNFFVRSCTNHAYRLLNCGN